MEIVKEYPVIFWAVYITFSLLVGSHAKDPYYRSMFGWTILAFLFTPLVALVFLFVAGPPMEARERVEADLAADLERRKKKVLEDGGAKSWNMMGKFLEDAGSKSWEVEGQSPGRGEARGKVLEGGAKACKARPNQIIFYSYCR